MDNRESDMLTKITLSNVNRLKTLMERLMKIFVSIFLQWEYFVGGHMGTNETELSAHPIRPPLRYILFCANIWTAESTKISCPFHRYGEIEALLYAREYVTVQAIGCQRWVCTKKSADCSCLWLSRNNSLWLFGKLWNDYECSLRSLRIVSLFIMLKRSCNNNVNN